MNKLKAFAAYCLNDSVRMKSSSGGIFYLLAETVIKNNGVVYGVAMDKTCTYAEYRCATNKDELEALQGSKYLQARIGNTYNEIAKRLKNGEKVLFSGVGCQINALKTFLGKEYDNLLCVDVICHGVPSPALWRSYVCYMEDQMGGKLSHVNFRCKQEGWKEFGMDEKSSLKQIFVPKSKDPYMQLFLSDYCLRPSCYSCKAKALRLADITLGDFWGIEKIAPKMNDNRGCSLVILRTLKGEDDFNKIKKYVKYAPVSYDVAAQNNPAELRSVFRPKQRKTFFSDYRIMNFDKLQRKYLAVPIKDRIKLLIKKQLKAISTWGGEDRAKAEIEKRFDYGVFMCFKPHR